MCAKMKPLGEDDVEQDAADAALCTDDQEADPNIVFSCVKMKLATFCPDQALRAMIDSTALRANDIIGEAYAFANFHLARVHAAGTASPSINQSFYYACLACVSRMNTRDGTLSADLQASAAAFDDLRPAGSTRVDATDLMDLMPDIAVTMATMATNHLWMNLCGRLAKYIKWKHPDVKASMRTVVVRFVAKFPSMPLDKIDQLQLTHPAPVKGKKKATQSLAEETVRKRLAARRLIEQLRSICPLTSGKHFASRAHLLFALYRVIHAETEAALLASATGASTSKKKVLSAKALGRFTMLPKKSSYTVSYIPISDRFMTALVLRLKAAGGRAREKLTGCRGTDAERRALWRKYFNVNRVETATRKFNDRIASDGVGVTVVMKATQALVQSNTNDDWDPSVLPLDDRRVLYGGNDPGITDVATVTHMDASGEFATASYSSSRYYERAKIKVSGRRTRRWNDEMQPVVDATGDLSTVDGLAAHTRSYLASVREAHAHRASRGYRNMRFLRFLFKKKAVGDICDMLAPPDAFTVLGYGDWSGPSGTPIKRRFCGPNQEIKKELRRRVDSVALRSVWEYKTSVLDSNTWTRMVNMKAVSWSRDRDRRMVQRKKSKIHKVMHCQTSKRDAQRPPITTWNRDVNASRNILMLLMMEIRGFERPSQFKPTSMPSRRVRANAPSGSNAGGVQEDALSERAPLQ
jgi:hypothetical protein